MVDFYIVRRLEDFPASDEGGYVDQLLRTHVTAYFVTIKAFFCLLRENTYIPIASVIILMVYSLAICYTF